METKPRNAIRKAFFFSRLLLKDVCIFPLALIGRFAPRKRQLWCFGACEGARYGDHSRMLFEECQANYPDIETVWSTRSPDVYLELTKRNLPVVMATSLEGFFMSLRAKVCFYTHYARDHNEPATTGAYRVQLWHGIPLKRFKADNNLTRVNKQGWPHNFYSWLKNARNEIFSWHEPKWDFVVFQSDLDRCRTGSAFRGQYKEGEVLGSVRAEYLVKRRADTGAGLAPANDSTRILYAPTHRKRGLGSVFESVPVPPGPRLSRLLDSYGAEIEVRMHPLQAHEPLPDGFLIPNVNVAVNELCCDIYTSLLKCDVVITDYSSIYIDALSVGVPVVCLAPDRDRYGSEDQGFYSNIEEFPGPIVDTWEEALAACDRLLTDGGDEWRRQYATAKTYYYGSDVEHDRGTMARVIEQVRSSV